MNAWDIATAVVLGLGAGFLTVHAVMVGKPEYGWQPRSPFVRATMVVVAVILAARSFVIVHDAESLPVIARWASAALSLMFLATWLDMMVASWKNRLDDNETETAARIGAAVVRGVRQVAKAAEDGAEVSRGNAERLDHLEALAERTAAAVSILEPAPAEFKDSIGYYPGTARP